MEVSAGLPPAISQGTPEPGSAATGFDPRELVREQELPAPVQQGQAAPFALRPVLGLGLAGPGRVVPRQIPLGLRDQRVDLGQTLTPGRLPALDRDQPDPA